MRTMKKLVLLLLLALSSVLLPACQSAAPRPYDVSLGYDPVTIERFRVFPSVEVDVVAANETILRQLEQTEIDDYFSPSNLMRDSLRKKTYYFSEEDHADKVLEQNDSVWDNWIDKRGSGHLILFVNLPRDGAKGPDMRKLVLPLAGDRWRDDRIEVSIIPAGLMLQTPIISAE